MCAWIGTQIKDPELNRLVLVGWLNCTPASAGRWRAGGSYGGLLPRRGLPVALVPAATRTERVTRNGSAAVIFE
jgi:hypothetical protein